MELQVLEQNAIVAAFAQEEGTKSLFEKIATEARSVIFDMSNKKERDALKSFAYNLARTKTTVDNYGKELVSEIKKKSGVIDADRKFWRDSMDSLQEEIRKPLTEYENVEKDRVARCEEFVQRIKNTACYDIESTSGYLKQSLAWVENLVIDDSIGEYQEKAKLAKYKSIDLLKKGIDEKEKYEAEQAELERLRQAEIEHQQKERDEKIAREAADKARVEAEAKAQAEANRIERERKEAAEKAEREKLEAQQREARLKAEKEAAELREKEAKRKAEEEAKQAEIDRQNAVEAERKRIEQEAQAKAEAERKAEEQRKANVEHMRTINREAFSAIEGLSLGIPEAQIKELITAIAKNQIPHISIKY